MSDYGYGKSAEEWAREDYPESPAAKVAREEIELIFKMPKAFKSMAADLLRALDGNSDAQWAVTDVLVAHAKDYLVKHGGSDKPLH